MRSQQHLIAWEVCKIIAPYVNPSDPFLTVIGFLVYLTSPFPQAHMQAQQPPSLWQHLHCSQRTLEIVLRRESISLHQELQSDKDQCDQQSPQSWLTRYKYGLNALRQATIFSGISAFTLLVFGLWIGTEANSSVDMPRTRLHRHPSTSAQHLAVMRSQSTSLARQFPRSHSL